MRSAERRNVNVLETICFRSLVGVSLMDSVRDEEMRRRAGIERELASRADQRVLRWFVRMDEHRMARKVLMAGTRQTEARLDGWCEGGLWQQRNHGGGFVTIRDRLERVESPGAYATE